MKKYLFLVSIAAFLVGASLVQGIQAQELTGGKGFRVTDPLKTLTINAGEAETERISVRNVTEATQTATAIIEDFGPSDDESGNPQIFYSQTQEEPSPYSIRSFVQPIQETILNPGEEKSIDVTLVVPEGTSPGSYFGVVRFISERGADNTQEGVAVSLNASVGIIFLVTVPGPTVDLLSLEQISAASDGNTGSVFSFAPNSLVLRLRNEGNTFQAPFGDLRISDWSGNVVQEISFNSGQQPAYVLPDSIRRFDLPLENISSFGRYRIEGFISYGEGSNIIVLNTTFWVVPWITVGIVAAFIVALAFFGTRGIKAYNRAIIRKAKGRSEKSMR